MSATQVPLRRSLAITGVLSLLATLLLAVFVAPPASATHIRGASLTWTPGAVSGDVVFSLTWSSRADYPNAVGSAIYPALGSPINVNGGWNMQLYFGDGQQVGPTLTVQSIDKVNDVLVATGQVTHHYASASTAYTAYILASARLSTILNNADTDQRVQTIVTPNAAAGSPTSTMPPIVDCRLLSACNFYVPATDPARRLLTFRMSTPAEMGGVSETQPPGASINPTTGLYQFTTTAASGLWSTQVMVEAHSGAATTPVVSSTAVDFLLRPSNTTVNDAPAFDGGTPADQTTIHGSVGNALAPISLRATDPNTADRVTLSVGGSLPPGVTLTAAAPANPGTATITGTPTSSGQYPVNLLASDQNGAQTFRSITFDIAKLVPHLTWSAPSAITYGTPLGATQLNATVTEPAATGTISYFLADGTTPAAGKVLSAGTAQTLIAAYTPNSAAANTYAPTTTSTTIDVNKASQTITVTSPGSHAYGDAPFALVASGGGSGKPVTFSSTTPGVCTTGGSNGSVVTILAAGACLVTANQVADANYSAALPIPVPITVGLAAVHLAWSNPGPVNLTYGDKLAGVESVTSGGVAGTIAYTLDDASTTSLADVLNAGLGQHVTASFTPTDTHDYLPATAVLTVNVAKLPQTVSLAPLPSNLHYGDAPFAAVVDGNATTPVTVTSSTPASCETDASGSHVTILGIGYCRLVASTDGDANLAPATSAVAETVIGRGDPTLTWEPENGTFGTYGDPLELGEQLNAVVSTASPYATVLPEGTISYTMPNGSNAENAVPDAGSYDVTATWTPDATSARYWSSIYSARRFVVAKAEPLIEMSDVSTTYGDVLHAPTQLKAALHHTNLDSSLTGTFAYVVSGASTPSTDAEGLNPGAGDYALTATFTPSAAFIGNYAVTSRTVVLHVSQAQQSITFAPLDDHRYGDAPFVVTATGGGSGNDVVLTPTSGSTCSVQHVDAAHSKVTITGAGGCELTATQAGDANHSAADAVTEGFTSDKATTHLTWTTPASLTYGDTLPASALSATVDGGVPGTVTYTEAGNAIAAGDLLPADDHTLLATFTPDDGADFYDTTLSVVLHVAKAPQVIGFDALADRTYGDAPFGLVATGGGSGNAVVFDAFGSCTVAGGQLTITGAGDCTVTADQAGDPNRLAASQVGRTFAIARAPQVLLVDQPADRTFGGAPFVITATGGGSGQPVTVSSNTTGICTASTTGTVTLLHAGDCIVTVSQAGTADFAPALDVPVTISVARATQSLALAAIPDHVYGDSFDVDVTAGQASAPTVVTLPDGPCSLSGLTVTASGVGDCRVRATNAGDGDWKPADVSRTFHVGKAGTSLSWTDPAAVTYGDALTPAQLAVTLAPAGLTGTLALVDESGHPVQRGDVLHAGTHTVTATFTPTGDDGDHYTGSTTQATVTVNQAAQTITFKALSDHTYGDSPFGVTAVGGGSGKPVTFAAAKQCTAVGDPAHSAATVSLTGAGSCDLTASQDGTGDFAAATPVTNSFGIAKGTPQLAWATPADLTYGAALGSGQLNASVVSPGVTGAFAYTLPGGGSAAGVMLNAGNYELTATFTPSAASSGNWQQAATSVTVIVQKASQQLTFNQPLGVTFEHAPLTLSAGKGASDEPVVFAASGACSVVGSTLTITHAGSCQVTATEDGNSNWLPSSAVVRTFQVAKATQTITVTVPSSATFGDPPLALSGTGGASGNPLVFSSTGAACSVTPSGSVQVHATGACQIAVDQAGSGDYDAAPTVVRTLTVGKKAQSVTFALSGTRTLGDLPFTVGATATSLLPVTFTAVGPCTVSGASVTLTGVGQCAVTARQSGNANWDAAAPVTRTVGVTYATALAFDNTKATKSGATIPVKVMLTSAGRNISAQSIVLGSVTLDGKPAFYPGSSQPGELFTYQGTTATGGFYQFNLKTDGLSAGEHTLGYLAAGDPVVHTVTVYIR